MAGASGNGGENASLKDQGNEFFKSGNYLKAAAIYTQAIKLNPENPTLYSNRAAAFLHLVKLSKALSDAEKTIELNPQWEKGYFRKGCVLEAMERYDDATAAFQDALLRNPKSSEVSRKINRLVQLATERKRVLELENIRSKVDMQNYLDPQLKPELLNKFGSEESEEIFSFIVDVMEKSIKMWHESGKVDPRVNFLIHEEKTDTEKYAPMVNIEKAFESPETHKDCFSFLRKYAEDSFSRAACLVAPKKTISYPQVWKGQGSRKWKQAHSDGFFVQFESPFMRKLWFVASATEKGLTFCRDPDTLDIGAHEVIPRIFKDQASNSA